eukprot:CAMPEP_0170390524 /NCGR_PEP_ID=MMETSP0117_2-20130122/19193_1 /TAXON_ID=400756 /ORGANISM="Durinskia baltica, Strain CSIRO CS-38" /LENGTH=231 /DNA_ID=CAMNT_0010646577 /DNA_START=17 /DNA_END=712 /DNA_ORIENTATION=-
MGPQDGVLICASARGIGPSARRRRRRHLSQQLMAEAAALHLAEGVAATIQALHRAHVLHAVLARAGDHGDEGQERRVQETLSGAFRGTAQVGHHEPTTAKHRTAPLLLRHVAPQFRRAHLGDAVAPPRDALVRRRAAWRSDGLLGGNVGSGPDDRRIAVADLGAPGEQGHSVVVAPLAAAGAEMKLSRPLLSSTHDGAPAAVAKADATAAAAARLTACRMGTLGGETGRAA